MGIEKSSQREPYVIISARKCYFIIPIIMGILGGGNGMKQSMDYNGSFDNVPSSVWMAVSFATLLIVILMIVVALFVSVVTVGAIFNYIKIFRGERNNPQFKMFWTIL